MDQLAACSISTPPDAARDRMGSWALIFLGRLTHRDTTIPLKARHRWRGGRAVDGSAVEATLLAIPFAFAYRHRLLDFSQTTPMALAALFVATSSPIIGNTRFTQD